MQVTVKDTRERIYSSNLQPGDVALKKNNDSYEVILCTKYKEKTILVNLSHPNDQYTDKINETLIKLSKNEVVTLVIE